MSLLASGRLPGASTELDHMAIRLHATNAQVFACGKPFHSAPQPNWALHTDAHASHGRR